MAVLLVGCLFALIAPSLMDVCNVAGPSRKDCGWQGINETYCQGRNCCWNALHSYSYCFYGSDIAGKLKTKTACEHDPPVVLQCNKNETISIHDVFYGRNNGDNSCHNDGSITCFNPRATNLVRDICRDNSTCTVLPKGHIWDFDFTCDSLNAQLVVHYICILRAVSSSTTTTVLETPILTVSSRATGQTSLRSEYIASTSVFSTSLSEQSSSSVDIETSLAAAESFNIMSTRTEVLESSSSIVAAQTSSPETSDVTASLSATMSTATIVHATSSKITVPVSSIISPGQASQSALSSVVPTYQGSRTKSAVTPSLSTTIKQPNSVISVLPSIVSSETVIQTAATTVSKLEPSANETRSSSLRRVPSTMTMHSADQSSTISTNSKQATSSLMPAPSSTSVTYVSTSRPSTTSSVSTTNPPNETDTNTGNQNKTTYIIIGACVGALIAIICFFLLIRYVKRRLDPTSHAMLANDVIISSQGTYYGVPMNDLQTGYDNPVQAEEKSDTESYSNQIYQLNSS